MPTIGSFHSFYWTDTTPSTVVVTPSAGIRGGYPAWQASVIAPSLFGVIGAWIEHQTQRLRWALRLVRRVERMTDEQQAVLERVIVSLESPAWPVARVAVRTTATTLGFNRPEAWITLSREMKASPGRAENTYRHLQTCTHLRAMLREQGSTVTNPQMHLVAELAYQGFAAKGR